MSEDPEFYKPTEKEHLAKLKAIDTQTRRELRSNVRKNWQKTDVKAYVLKSVFALYNYDFFKNHNWQWLNTAKKIVSVGNTDIVLRIIEDYKGQLLIDDKKITLENIDRIIFYFVNAMDKETWSKGFKEAIINQLKKNLGKNKFHITIKSIRTILQYSYPTMRKNFKKLITILGLPARKRNYAHAIRPADFLLLLKKI